MADSKSFMSPDFLTKFIYEYRDLPCLWKVRSGEYSNKLQRRGAWEHLVRITREKIPNADLNFVKKKVDSIRASFRKELRKIRDNTRSGASADGMYTPTLWYFELLKFTAEHEQPAHTKSILDENKEIALDKTFEEKFCMVEMQAEPNEDVNNVQNELTLNTESHSSSLKRRKISKKRARIEAEEGLRQRKEILGKASAVLNKPEDEYDDLGKTYAAKLRRMPAAQRDIADKLIVDVLYKGLQNTLTTSYFISEFGFPMGSCQGRDVTSLHTTKSNCSTPVTSSSPKEYKFQPDEYV